MKFNFKELTKYQQWVIINCITNTNLIETGSENIKQKFNDKWLHNNITKQCQDIKMYINDFEINPLSFFDEIKKQHDRIVKDEAKEIVNAVLDDMSIDIDIIKQDFEKKLKNKLYKKLKIKKDEE